MGNSEAVARKHYLQVTDEHFAIAQQAAQKAAQYPTITAGITEQVLAANCEFTEGHTQLPMDPLERVTPTALEPALPA